MLKKLQIQNKNLISVLSQFKHALHNYNVIFIYLYTNILGDV